MTDACWCMSGRSVRASRLPATASRISRTRSWFSALKALWMMQPRWDSNRTRTLWMSAVAAGTSPQSSGATRWMLDSASTRVANSRQSAIRARRLAPVSRSM